MYMIFLSTFSLALLSFIHAENNFYTAAICDVNSLENVGKTFDQVKQSVNEMSNIITSEKLQNVDILVLPEGVFNRIPTIVSLPTSEIFCNDENAHFLLKNISCAAKQGKKYVVMNAYMKIKCEDDDQDFCANRMENTNSYSMTLVFDRNGKTIAKYRKFNLFYEDVQITNQPELISFETDFGVTFGICVCLDLLSFWPQDALSNKNITNFVFPTNWYSQLPYLSAVQYQESWAYSRNVNLLASNINWPNTYSSGSGIYMGHLGAIKRIYNDIPKTQVLVATIPKTKLNNLEEATNVNVIDFDIVHENTDNSKQTINSHINNKFKQDNMKYYEIKFLNFEDLQHDGKLCQNGFCCEYNITIENYQKNDLQSYEYAISVFHGFRHYGTIDDLRTSQSICSLIACTEKNNKESCGKHLINTNLKNYVFKNIYLKTILFESHSLQIMPNTLKYSDLLPIDVKSFEYKVQSLDKNNVLSSLELIKPETNIFTFGLFIRDYTSHKIYNL